MSINSEQRRWRNAGFLLPGIHNLIFLGVYIFCSFQLRSLGLHLLFQLFVPVFGMLFEGLNNQDVEGKSLQVTALIASNIEEVLKNKIRNNYRRGGGKVDLL